MGPTESGSVRPPFLMVSGQILRQVDMHPGALARGRIDGDRSTVILNNAVSGGHPQSPPEELGREKGFKNALAGLFVHSRVIVLDVDLRVAARWQCGRGRWVGERNALIAGADRQFPVCVHGLQGIGHHRFDDDADLGDVAPGGNPVRRQVQMHLYRGFDLDAIRVEHLANQLVDGR